MVERRGTLQPRGFGHNAGNGGLGKAVDSGRVEGVSGRRRIAKRGQCTAPVHAHGSTAGNQRIRCCTRTDDFEVSGSPQRRTAEKARSQLPAGPPSFCCVVFWETGERPVCPRVSPNHKCGLHSSRSEMTEKLELRFQHCGCCCRLSILNKAMVRGKALHKLGHDLKGNASVVGAAALSRAKDITLAINDHTPWKVAVWTPEFVQDAVAPLIVLLSG